MVEKEMSRNFKCLPMKSSEHGKKRRRDILREMITNKQRIQDVTPFAVDFRFKPASRSFGKVPFT